ncbi:DUF4817 domain-containing protein [Trichonephila clavipes]|nr:DUF4817 domain-containing protein [Trichonephila clavipes]
MESTTLFLELSCNLIVKKLDNLNVLARLHLGAKKEFKWSHLDAFLESCVQDFLQSRCRNCGGGDRGRVAIYRPFGELRRAKIVLSPVWCSRPMTGVPLAHATMNFVGLDLTASDRRSFVEWAQNEIAVVPDFHKRILFSDEAHFWLNGYVNKQNCRIWSEANSQVYVETPLHTEKLTVRCALWAGGIIDPYFFKNDEGHNVTVNGNRSRDLIPLDYFLWGYVKSLVYADKPQTLDHLEDNIRRIIADIRPQMLEKVIENWTSRLDYIRASRGSPMPEILFKICITPIDSFIHVEFREELLTGTPKHSSHPELLKQLALELINDIPDQALIIYTDGSRSDTGRAGSGIFSNTPGNDARNSIRNPDHCSVFRSGLIAIRGALYLDHALNSYKNSIWIPTDSRSSIQYLNNWQKLCGQYWSRYFKKIS